LSYYFSQKIKDQEKEGQLISEEYNSQLVDTLLNLFAIKSFAREQLFKHKIYSKSHEWSAKQSHIQQYKMYPISVILAWVSASYTLTTGLVLIYLESKSLITIGDFIAVLPQSVTIMSFLRNFMFSVMNAFGNLGKIEQSYQIISDLHDINDIEDAKELKVTNGEIIFQNVTFAYKSNTEHKIFENFNLHIKKEERRIGIVGSSGCGKSTLVKLIARFYDVDSGCILIDGEDIKNVTQKSLHNEISFIPQDINLFNDTILNNIKYGKEDATDDEIARAIQHSNIDDFINEFPEKYNFSVGERGIKLSGGQRQRIAIARAILKNAPILILDEATSALDNKTEQWIEVAIENLIKINPKMTIIAIAHRLSTIKHMDRIVVMEDGKVVEDGSFTQLIEKENGKFKELWEHQVNGMVV
jgi:ATP-binding cassette subfamily B protein